MTVCFTAFIGCGTASEQSKSQAKVNKRKNLEMFENGTIGVIDGSIYAEYSKELFPNATIDSYKSFPDLFQCVKQGKIDGFMLDTLNYNAVKRSETGLSYISVPDYKVDIGFAFAKNDSGEFFQNQMNTFLDELRADGRLEKIWEKWCGDTEPTETLEAPEFSEKATPLSICLDVSRKPFVYPLNNEYAGFEVEVLYMFCEAYGYRPVFETAQWSSGLVGLGTGKYNVISLGIYITEERKESVNFSEPYVSSDVIMVFYEGAEEEAFTSVAESFDKTFIREDRWKMIVEGIGITLFISIFAIIGGSSFGFGLYMLTRSENKILFKVAKTFARIYGRIIEGTPELVILMILFYVLFGKSNINGVYISILGFVLIFGAFVYSHLALTIEGIDPGQMEAAYALGYTKNKTFFKILLPQALKVFMPTYSSQVVGLIKATSVVGYIAVNDLTSVGDIIRSNTYEAFFPLIAVAIIYFILTWIISKLLRAVSRRFEPKKRKTSDVLKGVTR